MISKGTQCVRIDQNDECARLTYDPFEDRLRLYEEHAVTPTLSMWVLKHSDYASAVAHGINHCATAIMRAKMPATYYRIYGPVYFSGGKSYRDIAPDDSASLHVFARLAKTEHERLIKEEV